MKNKLKLQLATVSLAIITILTACTRNQVSPQSLQSKKFESASIKKNIPITLGQAADFLLKAAEGYNEIKREFLLDNLEGEESIQATKLQTLVMVSRAFGKLPKPVGNNARLLPQDTDFTNIPNWAKADIENLANGGVISNSDLNISSKINNTSENDKDTNAIKEKDISKNSNNKYAVADDSAVENGEEKSKPDNITLEELETIIRRVWALFGTNLKDDFYNNVNKEYLDNSILPPGENTAGGLYDLRAIVTQQTNKIITDVTNGSGYTSGSPEQKIQDLFKSAANMEIRNKLGVKPLRKYLNLIDNTTTIEEFNEVQTQIQKELAIGGSLNLMLMNDYRDNKKRAINIQPIIMPSYTSEEYNDFNNKYISAQLKLNKTILMLAGENEADAEAKAKATFTLEQKLLPYKPSSEEFADSNKINKAVTFEELQSMFPNIDVKSLVEAYGFEVPEDFVLNAPSLLEAYSKLLNNENLELFKADAKITLLSTFARELSQDFLNAYNEYNVTVTGAAKDIRTPEELASDIVNSSLGEYIDQLYVKKHFSPEAKADVEKMIQSFIDNYKKRIKQLDWLSDATKEKAIEKLDNMKFFVGYPDEWDTSLDSLNIVPNDFFGNQTEIRKLTRFTTADSQFKPNIPSLVLPASMVNAYYNQFNNSMAFPAGILQAPFYDVNATEEENLAGIGTIIAHEITHAFDNNGAKYDKDGNPNDWWTPEDYAKFQELCDKATKFYDGWEAAAGVPISGKQTLGENIADIGSMACLLDILSQKENADYDSFFRYYAKSWMKASTRENTEFMAQFDEHSPGNLRTNRVLSNFQKFFDTYNIKEGDGMYVSPKDRIKIW